MSLGFDEICVQARETHVTVMLHWRAPWRVVLQSWSVGNAVGEPVRFGMMRAAQVSDRTFPRNCACQRAWINPQRYEWSWPWLSGTDVWPRP
eukprot:154132-Alexandrium_andersonii.AAC.1